MGGCVGGVGCRGTLTSDVILASPPLERAKRVKRQGSWSCFSEPLTVFSEGLTLWSEGVVRADGCAQCGQRCPDVSGVHGSIGVKIEDLKERGQAVDLVS